MSRLVLHVHTLPWVSGSGINTFLSMKLLDPKRYVAALACQPGGRLEDLVRENGMAFHGIEHMRAEISPAHDVAAVRELAALYRRVKPTIVHTHNSKAGFLGRLAGRFVPDVKIVHTVHGFAFHDRETRARRLLFRQLERAAFEWADRTIAISSALADWGAREGIGTRGDYRIVWSGIDVDRFHAADRAKGRALIDVADDQIAIGIVSKLWEGKGHEFLIDAAAPFLSRAVKLVFIGEGPIEPRLRARAAELDTRDPGGAPHVLFAGFHADVADVTAALDIAALPSEFEGMGRVLLEAQACGVPIVANRVGGIVDVVRDGGILLEPGDAEGWGDALRRLIDSPNERRAMGTKGRAFVTERFSAAAMVRSLEAIYDEL